MQGLKVTTKHPVKFLGVALKAIVYFAYQRTWLSTGKFALKFSENVFYSVLFHRNINKVRIVISSCLLPIEGILCEFQIRVLGRQTTWLITQLIN